MDKITLMLVAVLAGWALGRPAISETETSTLGSETMELGNFSVSLAVKDIQASKAFYEKLGFKAVGGNLQQNWVILQNSTSTIGLFQGMFEKNIMTFNPGWDRNRKTPESFTDVRDLQAALMKKGIEFSKKVEPGTAPSSFVIADPDGNTILVDQHVPAPKKQD